MAFLVSDLSVGDPAPEFKLSDANGTEMSLSEFQGKWVVLYFYPKDNTPGCSKEAVGFRDYQDAFLKQDVMVLGVSPDDLVAHQKFIKKLSLPFTLLCDPDALVAKAYGSYGPKKFMGKSYEGVYRQTFVIDPSGRIAQLYRKVKPETHAAEVLKEIVSLQS
jgi:thioredoxin-dependent peroxiredoxin